MNILFAVLEGIAGTLVMTFFVMLICYATGYRLNVVKILGTMLTGKTSPTGGLSNEPAVFITGTITHYFVGAVFSIFYHWLWYNHISSPGFVNCILLGFLCGVAGIATWTVFFKYHPHPPQIKLFLFLPIILIGHLFFGAGVYAAHRILVNSFPG